MDRPKKMSGRGPAPKNYMTLQEGVEIPSSIVNDKPVNKNVENITEKNYERQLRNWDDFVEAFGPRSVDSLEDLKEYVLRLGLAMRAGLRPEQKLAAKGIKSYWKKFTAGYNRERGTIPKDHVLSVTRLIEPRGALGKLLNLVADTGPRRHATAEVLTWAGEFSWTLDWKIFAQPRLRIDHWTVLQAAAFTAARVSDYIESSARYQSNDTTLIVFRNESGETEFGLQLTKWLKGRRHEPSTLPTPDIHERGNLEAQLLYMNPILFLLSIFCSAGALRDYMGLDGLTRLLDLEVGPGEPAVHIRWHINVLHSPIFSGPSERIMTANLFSSVLRSLFMRAGFPDPPGLHCFRAEGLTNIVCDMPWTFAGAGLTSVDANPTYSDIQRQTTAGHVTNSIQARYYSSRNPGIDSQAAFMRTQARLMNIGEHFRNLEISWEPELWHSLPIKRREKLAMTEEYQDIEAKIRGSPTSKPKRLMDISPTEPTELEVKADIKTSPPVETKDSPLAHPIRKLSRDLENLERRELSELWEETSKSTVVGNKRAFVCRGVNRPFTRLRSIMPLRGQLADLLMIKARLRSPEGRASLEALVKLYQSKSEVDRPGLGTTCHCRRLTSDHLHVYQCTKKHVARAEFCFFCNQWLYEPEAWEQHCHKHLTQDHIPMELSWERVETTFLPGYCPFCLWDARLGCSKRLQSFYTLPDWETHIRGHGVSWQARCPDLRCAETFPDGDSFQNHLHDLHHVPKRLFKPAETGFKTGFKRGVDDVTHQGVPAKKTKIGDASVEAHFVFQYCSVEETKPDNSGLE
ncbi:hypothetical protein BN1723_010373 [Verticillium longisporum]|uniref:C2H2-type domain-containing protein n=1 Tax=Verticillium longisporum TaxID=100787 RepID=A0A0G4KXW5_VERLO|nr:hypothetical protein BN1723_010373 [Verticillium longisporum]CRK15995.1 hypothetical protein BN1708_011626 [Verticillium longisporum]